MATRHFKQFFFYRLHYEGIEGKWTHTMSTFCVNVTHSFFKTFNTKFMQLKKKKSGFLEMPLINRNQHLFSL